MDLPTPIFSEATYMCIFPIIILAVIKIRALLPENIGCFQSASVHNDNQENSGIPKIIALLLSVLYIVMSSATEVLKGTATEAIYSTGIGMILKIVLLAAGCVSCYTVIRKISKNIHFQKTTSFRRIGNTPIYLVVLPVAFLSVFCIAGCYPGIVSSDSGYSWYEVMTGYYRDWHPLTYMYLLKITQKLFGVPYPIVIFQAVFWIAINQYALSLLEKYAPYKYIDICYLIINVLMICNYRALGNVEKDSIWNMGIFLFSLCLFHFIKTRQKLKWYDMFFFLLSSWITATIRHTGDAIVIVTLAVVLIYEFFSNSSAQRAKRKLTGLIMLSVILIKFLLVNLLGFMILNADANEPYVKYSVPMSMIGAVAVQEQIPEEDLAVMEEIMPLEKWQDCYDKYYADEISRTYGPIGDDILKLNDNSVGKDVLLLNLKFLFRYPVTYLTAFFDMSSIVWEMGTPVDGYEWMPTAINSYTLDGHPEINALKIRRNISTDFQEAIVSLSDQTPIWNSVCWRGGFALFTFLLSAAILLRKKRPEEILALLPAFLLAGVLFLANPSQDPRYINSWQMFMGFFLVYSIFVGEKADSEGSAIHESIKL